MKCIVTAGPTYEPLDEVRRLTNFSTGELGCLLADALSKNGHDVTLLLGRQATFRNLNYVKNPIEFTTSESLKNLFNQFKDGGYRAIFHTAAVCDYAFGRKFIRDSGGNLLEVKAGKFETSLGNLLVELTPVEKIIASLRKWFPNSIIVGWKYGVDGTKISLIDRGRKQIEENRTDACVLNGPAYGDGFGVLFKAGHLIHYDDKPSLVEGLVDFLKVAPSL